jgi:hypothetical protein
VTIREQARADINRLAAIRYIVRDDLHPEVQGAWRNAIVGVGHGRGLRIDMGRVGRKVWASVNATVSYRIRRGCGNTCGASTPTTPSRPLLIVVSRRCSYRAIPRESE